MHTKHCKTFQNYLYLMHNIGCNVICKPCHPAARHPSPRVNRVLIPPHIDRYLFQGCFTNMLLIITYYTTPYHFILYHITYHTILHRAISYHTIECHVIPMSYHTIPRHSISYHTIPLCTTPTYCSTSSFENGDKEKNR